jgi:hypothetical protein
VAGFSESQNRHKWSHGFFNIKAGRHKKSQKRLAKTTLLKLSKTSRIVTVFNRHNMESQMVAIVTVVLRLINGLTFPKKSKDRIWIICNIIFDISEK